MIARPMLQLIGVAVGEAIASLNKNDLDSLGEIMNLNHHLLGGLNVSSPILDAMCSAARAGGARGAKLTGAGGGGCILALPPDPAEPLLTVLREQGYAPFRVTVR
jgi:mevalonate kinase